MHFYSSGILEQYTIQYNTSPPSPPLTTSTPPRSPLRAPPGTVATADAWPPRSLPPPTPSPAARRRAVPCYGLKRRDVSVIKLFAYGQTGTWYMTKHVVSRGCSNVRSHTAREEYATTQPNDNSTTTG
jgi:hypothetical protein